MNKSCMLATKFQSDLMCGKYKVGDRFPCGRVLAKENNASRDTVRRAVEGLLNKGIIRKKGGRGGFVVDRIPGAPSSIGVLVSGCRYSEIFPVISASVHKCAKAAGYSVVSGDASVLKVGMTGAKVLTMAKRMIKEGVKGVVMQPVEFTSDFLKINAEIVNLFDKAGIPVVLVDCDIVRIPARSGRDVVGIDNFGAGCAIGRHLMDLGVKRIAFIARRYCADSVNCRLAGVRHAVGNVPVDFVAVSDFGDGDAIGKVLRRLVCVDAIVCQNDVAAVKVAETLERMGLAIPRDVKLAGFDGVGLFAKMHPALTTVRQPCEEIGRIAFERLAARLSGDASSAMVIAPGAELVIGGSTTILQ